MSSLTRNQSGCSAVMESSSSSLPGFACPTRIATINNMQILSGLPDKPEFSNEAHI